MYPSVIDEKSAIDVIRVAGEILVSYNREKRITKYEKNIADLKEKCELIAQRTDLLKQFSSQFFEERKKIRTIAMAALDVAIAQGNADIAAISMAMIGNEYSQDFFGMMNDLTSIK